MPPCHRPDVHVTQCKPRKPCPKCPYFKKAGAGWQSPPRDRKVGQLAGVRARLAVKQMSSLLRGLNSGEKAFQMPQRGLPTSLHSPTGLKTGLPSPCPARESATAAGTSALNSRNVLTPVSEAGTETEVSAGRVPSAGRGGRVCPRPLPWAGTRLSLYVYLSPKFPFLQGHQSHWTGAHSSDLILPL